MCVAYWFISIFVIPGDVENDRDISHPMNPHVQFSPIASHDTASHSKRNNGNRNFHNHNEVDEGNKKMNWVWGSDWHDIPIRPVKVGNLFVILDKYMPC